MLIYAKLAIFNNLQKSGIKLFFFFGGTIEDCISKYSVFGWCRFTWREEVWHLEKVKLIMISIPSSCTISLYQLQGLILILQPKIFIMKKACRWTHPTNMYIYQALFCCTGQQRWTDRWKPLPSWDLYLRSHERIVMQNLIHALRWKSRANSISIFSCLVLFVESHQGLKSLMLPLILVWFKCQMSIW